MIEPIPRRENASDDYPLHVLGWPVPPKVTRKGIVVVLHGVRSHAGWYHDLGRTLAERGYETHFPDRRGSGSNTQDRGHTPSAHRLIADVGEIVARARARDRGLPLALAGISWGGKVAALAAARFPEWVDALALICPGLHPRVDITSRERLRIAAALLTGRKRAPFPIPLSDPTLFTANPEGQRFIADDPLGLKTGTTMLMVASFVIDRRLRRAASRIRQPLLLMLAGQDRIVDNARTRALVETFPSVQRDVIEYPEGHHTLEFEADPNRYARDLADWLDLRLSARTPSSVGAS